MTTFLDRIRRRDPISESRFKWLGRLGAFEYGRLGDKEYAVSKDPAEDKTYKPDVDEILVGRRVTEVIDGTQLETIRHHRAWPTVPGTYAREAAKARRLSAERPMRAWDRLASLIVMQKREPLRMVTGPATKDLPVLAGPLTSDEEQAIAGVVELARNRPSTLLEVGGNEPPERSVAGLVAFIQSRGVELSLARGRLVARSRLPIQFDVRELIEHAQELIIGQLQGKPVMCSHCGEPAVTVVFPDAPTCAEHEQ